MKQGTRASSLQDNAGLEENKRVYGFDSMSKPSALNTNSLNLSMVLCHTIEYKNFTFQSLLRLGFAHPS